MFDRVAAFVQHWTPPRPCPLDCRPVKYRYEKKRNGYVAVGARCTEGRWARWNAQTNRWQMHEFSFNDWGDGSTITRN